MDDQQLLRYSRQIMLPNLDIAGQQRINQARVLIIGMGGLGSPVAMYLAAAGVGHLTLVDDDNVDLTNLQRQIVHSNDDIGRPKVESARKRLSQLNPLIKITTLAERLSDARLDELLHNIDVVVDASDNFTTRFQLNRACVKARKPLVSGAAIRLEGQVAVFANQGNEDPCYRCLYRDEGDEELRCSESGILAPVVGVIGSLQAVETLKVISGLGKPLTGRLMVYDAAYAEWRVVKLRKDPHCPVCGGKE